MGTFSHNSKVYLSFENYGLAVADTQRDRELWQVGETNMPPILFLIDQDVHGGMFLAN